jgi:hypothetical protein
MTYHIVRRKQLLELHDTYIRYVNESCYPLILEIFNEFSKLIKQQADINQEFQRIQRLYNQTIPIESCRPVINNELQRTDTIDVPLSSDPQPPSTCLEHTHVIDQEQLTNPSIDDSNTILINTIHVALRNTIDQAESNSDILAGVIEQLRARIIG